MNYMPEDSYNSLGQDPYSGDYHSYNGGPHHDANSIHSSHVSLHSTGSNRHNPRQVKLEVGGHPLLVTRFGATFNSLPKDKILDWSKSKAFADDRINVLNPFPNKPWLAPLAMGQRAYVMVRCLSCVCPSVR